MKLIIALLIIFCTIPGLHAQDKQVKVDSKISEVIVFLSGAQVKRQTAAIDIPAGISQLVFSSLSPDIEAQSIQVKGDGAFTILSVNKQSNFLEEQQASAESSKLAQLIKEQNEKIDTERNKGLVLKVEEDILAKNQVVLTDAGGLDLVKLQQALDFHRKRLTDIKASQLEQQRKLDILQTEMVLLQRQLRDLTGKAKTNTSDIVVKVSAKAAIKGTLAVSYLVKNASWYPTYDLRAKDVASPIDLVYKANVTQRSSEDWKDVKLVLSSGNPSTSGNKPELRPYTIGYNVSNSAGYGTLQSTITSVNGRVQDLTDGSLLAGVSVIIKGTSIGALTDANGNYSIQIPSGGQRTLRFNYLGYEAQEVAVRSPEINVRLRSSARQLSEVVTTDNYSALQGRVSGLAVQARSDITGSVSTFINVESQQTQTSIQFAIQDPYTILSDGKQFTVDIGQHQLPATYEYYAVPKISPDAFLTAKITSINDLNLLSGEANVFFEGTFLGKSLIDVQNSSDTLNISLGTDKNIVIKRDRQKDFNDKQFLGSSQRVTRDFIIDIRNRKTQAINLVVEDQIPVSNTDEVTVEKQELSGAKPDETTGKLIWKLALQPNEQKKLQLKYQVRFPKNRTLIIE